MGRGWAKTIMSFSQVSDKLVCSREISRRGAKCYLVAVSPNRMLNVVTTHSSIGKTTRPSILYFRASKVRKTCASVYMSSLLRDLDVLPESLLDHSIRQGHSIVPHPGQQRAWCRQGYSRRTERECQECTSLPAGGDQQHVSQLER